MAERDRLQPGESVSASGAAAAGWQVVVDELATTVGEDRRPADQARALLLVVAGRGSPDAAAVWGHGPADGGVAGASRIAGVRAEQTGFKGAAEGGMSLEIPDGP